MDYGITTVYKHIAQGFAGEKNARGVRQSGISKSALNKPACTALPGLRASDSSVDNYFKGHPT